MAEYFVGLTFISVHLWFLYYSNHPSLHHACDSNITGNIFCVIFNQKDTY